MGRYLKGKNPIVQDLSAELAAAREKADRSGEAEEKHQKGVAMLTADNVVQLLRLRQCEVPFLQFCEY